MFIIYEQKLSFKINFNIFLSVTFMYNNNLKDQWLNGNKTMYKRTHKLITPDIKMVTIEKAKSEPIK